MNEIAKYEPDSFDGFVERSVDDERGAFSSEITLKFVDPNWIARGDQIVTGLIVVLMALDRVVQKQGLDEDGRWCILETRQVAPGLPFPSLEELNAKVPRTEYVRDFNKNLVPPWMKTTVARFTDPEGLDQYCWYANMATTGSAICISEIHGKVKMMRQFRGSRANPVVRLESRSMPTRFGTVRQRPFMAIERFIDLGSGQEQAVLPKPQQPAIEATVEPAAALEPVTIENPPEKPKAAAKTKAVKAKAKGFVSIGDPVEPLSLKEEMNDTLPF
jgi:hypothetical protein